MFSKPIMVAASVAAANATLLKLSAVAHTDTANISDVTGCGLCLMLTKTTADYPKYIIGSATVASATAEKYNTVTASTDVALATN